MMPPFRDHCPMCSATPVERDHDDRIPLTIEVVEHSFDCPWVAANADRIRTEHAVARVLYALAEAAS